jgi:hypothetical protein
VAPSSGHGRDHAVSPRATRPGEELDGQAVYLMETRKVTAVQKEALFRSRWPSLIRGMGLPHHLRTPSLKSASEHGLKIWATPGPRKRWMPGVPRAAMDELQVA